MEAVTVEIIEAKCHSRPPAPISESMESIKGEPVGTTTDYMEALILWSFMSYETPNEGVFYGRV